MSDTPSKCMRLQRPREPLKAELRTLDPPQPNQVLLKVRACGVCRTDLHVVDGELPNPRMPIVPGHEIVGEVVACGENVRLRPGARLGVPWLGHTCGKCEFCTRGEENLCDNALFTGYQLDGGYADYVIADARYCFEIPSVIDDTHAAPLLCAGLIGYRALRMAGDAHRLGIYGFGAAAHIVAQIALHRGQEIFAFTRPGNVDAQRFAERMGARWTGGSDTMPPVPLDASIIFAPIGALVPASLRALRKGGTVVCAGIHMSDVPSMPYSLLWGERVVRSVANLTRRDGREFFELITRVPVQTHVETYGLAQANEALQRLRSGSLSGAAVLVP